MTRAPRTVWWPSPSRAGFCVGVLMVMMIAIAGCGSDGANAPQVMPRSQGVNFGGAELYFVQLSGGGEIWRFDERARDVHRVPLGEAAQDRAVTSIATSQLGDELFALTVDRQGNARVDRSSPSGLEPIVEIDDGSCLSTGNNENEMQVLTDRESEFDSLVGALSDVVTVDVTNGSTSVWAFDERYLFCPVWSRDGAVAFGGAREDTEAFTVPLYLQANGREQQARWPGCALMPIDFNSDGSQLAISVICSDEPKESGLYLLDTADISERPAVTRAGAIGGGSWSPNDRWIAYAHSPVDENGDTVFTQVEALELATNEYVSVEFLDTSWPAWIIPEATERS